MKKEPSKPFLIILGASIFNIIFWQEKPGINIIIFDAFICTSVCLLFPFALRNRAALWLLALHILCAILVVINNTFLSEIAFAVTLLLFISFSQYIHRSVVYASGSAFLNYLFVVPNLFAELGSIRRNTAQNKRRSWVRMLLIPLFLSVLFGIIYSFANGVFSIYINNMATSVNSWFKNFFDWFSINRILFFIAGAMIVGGLLLRSKDYFSKKDLLQNNNLPRKKDRFIKWSASPFADVMHIIIGERAKGILALKNEYFIGKASLVLLNLLLLFINGIDVKYVWLGYAFSNSASASEYVHEGTGMLIFSVVLAMCLLLFFFRGNINFYKKNKWLKYLAYLWILQNLFLVLSVFNRDYYYISHFALAYKRIGLLFFLAMVLSGLLTIFFKIRFQKTTYYLLRLNAWVALTLLVSASFVNWDVTIAKYNIARSTSIPLDMHFILSLSDKTLPIIEQHPGIFNADTSGNTFYWNNNYYDARQFFEFRKQHFINSQRNYTWLSWNVADANVKKELAVGTRLSSLK